MSIETPVNDLYLAKARACLSPEESQDLYDKWATTYNAEVGDPAQEYVAPMLVAQLVSQVADSTTDSTILDAGCGTGLVGQAIALTGAKRIDGLDLSPAMLKIAKATNVYRDLAQADLTRNVDKPNATYDIVTCVGTFTSGHVGPNPALQEFIRITKKGGFILATILEEIWEPLGFRSEVEKLKAGNLVEVVADGLIDYVKGHGDKAIMLILKKN